MISTVPLWLVITVFIVIGLVILFRTMNEVYLLSMIKKNFFYFVLIGVLIFVTISVTSIYSKNHLGLEDLSSLEGLRKVTHLYFAWLAGVFANIIKTTGYVLQQDWINSTGG